MMTTTGQSLSQEADSLNRGGKRRSLRIIKKPLRVGLWNTRTLHKEGNKEVLVNEAERYNLDACGICETHITGTDIETIEGWTLINSGLPDIHARGVGLLLSRRTRESLMSYETINERIIRARLYAKQVKVTIIVAYAPTEEADDEVKDQFYEVLQSVADEIPRHDIRLVIGDFNAKVGSDNSNWTRVMGPHGVGVINNNGLRLVEYCAENDMVIGGTLFQHKTIHKTTWTSPDGNTHNQIDHVLINGKWRKSLLDVRTFRGADIGSDHDLVVAKIQIKLAAQNRKSKMRKLKCTDLQLSHVSRDYQSKIAETFENLSDVGSEPDIDHEWTRFKETVYKAAEETVGHQTRENKKWISKMTCELIEERRTAKRARDQENTEANKKRYRELDKRVKNSAEKDWKSWLDGQAKELEEASSQNNQRGVFQKVKMLTGKKTSNTPLVKDKEGNIIGDEKKKLERWAEHFSELLNAEPPANAMEDIPVEWDQLDVDLSDPTREEIAGAIKRLKNNKAPGYDEITAEMLKTGGDKLVDWLLRICIVVWHTENVPQDWKRGVIIKLPKKGDLTICSNNRGITLLSIAGKVLCIMVLLRIRDAADELLRENQAGFRKGRSCTDQCFALRQLVEKCLEFQLPVNINFIDFKAAFDSVDRKSLWKILEAYGFPTKIVNIMKNTYDGSECCVKVDGETTEWFPVSAGVRQGCVWSPLLFAILIDWMLKQALDRNDCGIVLERRRSSRYLQQRLSDLDFADDIALIDESEERLQYATTQVKEEGKKLGLTINSMKTKVMAIAKDERTLKITLNDLDTLEKVEKFVYLGSTITSDGDLSQEINNRIGKAASAFNTLLPIMRHKSIQLRTKIAIYRAVVITTLLYGAEAWNTTVQQEKRLSAFHTRCLRRILGISWRDHVTNVAVLERTGEVPLMNILRQRRLTWFGHVVRMDSTRLPRRLLHWTPLGRRRPGRQRMRWRDTVTRDLQSSLTFEEAMVAAQNRGHWRTIVLAL